MDQNPVPAGEAPATRRRTVPIPVVIMPRPAVPGLVWAYRFDEAGRGQRLADDQPIDLALPGEGFRWLHLNLVDRRACHWLANHPALPPAAREIMTSADHHQRVLVADGMLMAVLHDFRRDLDRSSSRTACLHLVLADRFLLSGRQQPLQAADATRRAIEAGQLAGGGPVALLEAIVSGVADAAAEVAAAQIRDLEAIEDAVLGDRRNADPGRLAAIRRRSVHLHRQLGGLRALFHRIEREPPGRLPPPLIETAARIAQRLDALDGDIVAIQQQARLLQDEINSRIASRVNRHLYILSVITALFLPPSVIAGIFGMNLGGLPLTESPSGFLVGMLLIAASPVLVYLVLWLVRRAPSLEDPGPAPG